MDSAYACSQEDTNSCVQEEDCCTEDSQCCTKHCYKPYSFDGVCMTSEILKEEFCDDESSGIN